MLDSLIPRLILCIPAFAADVTGVNPNVIKRLLANGLGTFVIKDKPVFSNTPKSLLRTLPDCTILDR